MNHSVQNVIKFVGQHLTEIGVEEGQKMIDTAETQSFQHTLKPGAINEIFPDEDMRRRFCEEVATSDEHQIYVEITEQFAAESMQR